MKKRLYLHIGTHKTGSTYLQKFASENRKYLAEKNLYYADYDVLKHKLPEKLHFPASHHHFARALMGADKALTRADCDLLVDYWDRAMPSTGSVLLSAESISRLGHTSQLPLLERRAQYLSDLKSALAGFDVVPVLVLRSPDEYARSLFENRAMKWFGRQVDFNVLVDELIEPGHMFDYEASVKMISEIYGKVVLIDYEHLRSSGDYLQAFFTLLGFELDEEICRKWRNTRVGESLGIVKSYVKAEINPSIETGKNNRELIARIASDTDFNDKVKLAYPSDAYNIWKCRRDYREVLSQKQDEIRKVIPLFQSHEPTGLIGYLSRDLQWGEELVRDEGLVRFCQQLRV